MTGKEYFTNIYRIKNVIQKLDDEFWDKLEEITPEQLEQYNLKRASLLDELEKAYTAK